MHTLEIRKHKRSGGLARWGAYVLDEDAFGTWLFVPKGTTFTGRGADGLEATAQMGQGHHDEGCDVMFLVPRTGWYFPQWWAPGVWPWSITIDISTPPVLDANGLEYTDLELDLFVTTDGLNAINDLDEFIAECDAGLITPEEKDECIRTAASLERQLRRRDEPFGGIGWDYFSRAVGLGLAPLL